ncbi:hypothetical protein OC835_000604 [Tilletia horrida]|nr:hypothetical protein OC835_000604 [Tilletia horrida]
MAKLSAVLLLVLSSASSAVWAQGDAASSSCPPSNPEILGRACSLAANRLAQDTNQFLSDCGYTAFCDPATNTCQPNRCRRDEYPFGYRRKCEWPPMCDSGFFCPDEGSGCLPAQRVGSPCQLNRDDECALSARGFNTMCLRNVCQAINATAGQPCISDNVIYNIYTSYSSSYGEIVSRDNCVPGYYCDGTTEVCLATKNVGDACSGNKECKSYNCVDSSVSVDIPLNNQPLGRCGRAPSIPNRPGIWVYIVITLAIVFGAVALCCALVQVHARGRRRTRQERKRYFEKQALLRDEVYDAYFRATGREYSSVRDADGTQHLKHHGVGGSDGFGDGRAYGSLSAMSQRSNAVNPLATAQPLTLRGENEAERHHPDAHR